LFKEILTARGCEIEKVEIVNNHVEICRSIPPKYSVGDIVSVLKSVSAKEMFQRHPEVKNELLGGKFCEDG